MMPLLEITDVSTIVLIVGAIVLLILLAVILKFLKLWIQAYFSRANVSLFSLVGMWLRKVNASVIVNSKVMAVQAGRRAGR